VGEDAGKSALGIRVVRADDLLRVSHATSFGRAGCKLLLALLVIPLVVAYLWPLWDKRNQTLHDKMAGTIVIREPPSSTSTWPPPED
jgi:uncharacterized RDD family membrane protein YckC